MIPLTKEALSRSRIFSPCEEFGEYDALFRASSPVPAPTWSEPGSPPRLEHRAGFNDRARNDRLRGRRALLKGRFAGGRVGYVFADELETFACAFANDPGPLTETRRIVLDTLDREGPLSVGLLKEITGLLVKQISPALQALQQAFLVYEDQVDGDMERSFYILEKEFPDVRVGRVPREEALSALLPRWAHLCGSADAAMLRSLSGFPVGVVERAARLAAERGELALDDDGRWVATHAPGGLIEVSDYPSGHIVPLESSDFLVRAHQHLLTKRCGTGVIKTLLIDGTLAGWVKGRFRFGPHDVEDVVVDAAFVQRRSEILRVVGDAFSGSMIQRYNGVPL